jgi:hypothetical protein
MNSPSYLGGEGEIRTLGTSYDDHTPSKRALSTAQTPLRDQINFRITIQIRKVQSSLP